MHLDNSNVRRPFNFQLGFAIPLLAMVALLLVDPTRIDFFISNQFYINGIGFVGRHSYWLETVLHERAKQALVVLSVSMGLLFLGAMVLRRRSEWGRPLGYIVLTIALSTGIVPPLKVLTAVQCPWSLQEFGGTETYTALLSKRVQTSSPGRCWPGGHASTGFALLGFFFVLRDRHPRLGRLALGIAVGLGVTFSIGRVLQGAHFMSHNIWTFLLDWTICLACYRWLLYRPGYATTNWPSASRPSSPLPLPSSQQ